MGRRNKQRVQAIRYGNATPIALQRQLEKVERLSEEYGGKIVAEVIAELQAEGKLKSFWSEKNA